MLLLCSTSDVIKVVTDVSCTVDVHASWVDRDSTTDAAGRTNSAITTATTTTVVAAPASSTARNVRFLSIANKHATTSVNVTIQHYDGSTTIQIYRIQLLAGWTIVHFEGRWFLLDASGVLVQSPLAGRYLGTTLLTSSSGTFTSQAATRFIFIRGVGPGGGGAGCTTVASAASAGGGGGAGGYVEKLFPVLGNTGYLYTCGGAGTGSSGAAGNNGAADSTFIVGATTVTAVKGSGAPVATAVNALTSYVGGAGGTVSTNGDVNVGGQPGENGHVLVVATPVGASGAGGSGPFGAGGVGKSAVGNGAVGIGYGAGGGGAITGASTVRTGGDGTAGCWVVDEYS